MGSPTPSLRISISELLADDDAAVREWATTRAPVSSSAPSMPALRAPTPSTSSAPTAPSVASTGLESGGEASDEVVSVAVRMRGLNSREISVGEDVAWRCEGRCVREAEAAPAAEGREPSSYVFPAVFGPATTQAQVYAHVRPIVLGVLDGYNGTIFAYGHTSAGKTFTMQGPREAPGLIPRALADLFAHLAAARQRAVSSGSAGEEGSATEAYALPLTGPAVPPPPQVTLSYCELYNEELLDLLSPEQPPGGLVLRDVDAAALNAARDSGRTPSLAQVEGLREVPVADARAAAAWLAEGEARRHVSETALNRASSRSHTLLRLTVTAGHTKGSLLLVDLAGSERGGKSGVGGTQWGEGVSTNLGLLALGRCVRALAQRNPGVHVPFRDAVLTRLLAGALGGNARAAAICCITPAASHAGDTRGTLQFAQRCMLVTQRAVVNEEVGDSAEARLGAALREISRLKAQVAQLQTALLAARRRSTEPGAGPGPVAGICNEETLALLHATEAECERLRGVAAAAEAAAAAERRVATVAQRRLVALQGSLGAGHGGSHANVHPVHHDPSWGRRPALAVTPPEPPAAVPADPTAPSPGAFWRSVGGLSPAPAAQ